jgi:hypothetical protein
MKLRFSRTSLNLIIFTCIVLIGWASINQNNTVDELNSEVIDAISPLELANLEPLNQQSWTSQEGIQVIWQSRLDTNFLIQVRGTRTNKTPSIDTNNISWQPVYWQWNLNLGTDFEKAIEAFSQQLKDFPPALKGKSGSIVLQGPWSPEIARLTSARIIKDLALKPMNEASAIAKTNAHHCPWQPISAQFWLQDQLTQPGLSQPNMASKTWRIKQLPALSTITASSLHSWKQVFAQQWQASWVKPQKQFDILSDLAYYRLPANYLLQGYWQINELTPAVLEDYLAQCRRDVR